MSVRPEVKALIMAIRDEFRENGLPTNLAPEGRQALRDRIIKRSGLDPVRASWLAAEVLDEPTFGNIILYHAAMTEERN